jgi:hypothetical protein
MYAWIWQRLPGPWPVKLLEAVVAFVAVVAVLFVWVFPWLEPRLPFNDVTVEDSQAWTPLPGAVAPLR